MKERENSDRIEHVSDTALMVAACRAIETGREHGFVHDPFAEKLAGARGMTLAQNLPTVNVMCFGVGIRSLFLDELLLKAIAAAEIKSVLSLGSGLDSRPYRLDLPPDLHWIEVDFEDMLEYKAAVLANDRSRCRLERMPADLNDPAARAALFAGAADGAGLMITEGLLMYLPGSTVEALAAEAARSSIRRWILDVTSAPLAQRLHQGSWADIESVRAAGHLRGAEVLDVPVRNGWSRLERRTYTVDGMPVVAARMKAEGAPPAPAPREPFPTDDPSGVYLFGR